MLTPTPDPAENTQKESATMQDVFFAHTLDAIICFSTDWNITHWNPQAETVFGWQAEQITGSNLYNIFPLGLPSETVSHPQNAGETITRSVLNKPVFTTAQSKSGAELTLQVVVIPNSPFAQNEYTIFARDYTQQKELEGQVSFAKDTVEIAERAKSEFLANMSHEIRTPMNAILGLAGLLMDTPLNAEQHNFVSTIRRSGDALLSIFNDILDYSKIEAGNLNLEIAPFDLRVCIEEALDLFAIDAGRKYLDLAYHFKGDVPAVIQGDMVRVRQILINLVGNAVKFTENGEVSVLVDCERLSADQLRLHFTVKDTGIGISSEQTNRLFLAFSQLDPTTRRRYGGTGLGLAICYQLIQLMGGKIWVESEPGKGSTFHFTFETSAVADDRYAYLQHPQPQLRGQRVMIIDDNPTNRLIIERQTISWGMITESYPSGPAALDRLGHPPGFDIVLLDVHMPDMDGIAVAQEIRKVFPRLPIVIVSSSGRSEIGLNDINIDAYLHKPIKPALLYNVLLQLAVERKRATGELQLTEGPFFDHELATRHPLRILVAEDNIVNQKVVIHLLNRLGYQPDLVSNGLEVLSMLENRPYDVILMDVQMPEMDGVQAARQILNTYAKHHRPRIVAVTAHALQGDRERYLSAGLDDYISKPIRVQDLVASLEKCVAITDKMPRWQGLIDLSYLKEQFGTDADEILQELLPIFMREASTLVKRLLLARAKQDKEEIFQAGHALFNACSGIGAMRLADLCKQLEVYVRHGIGEQDTLVDGIAKEYELLNTRWNAGTLFTDTKAT
ncbi:MAG TPA: response regulator [Anaerolineales bacterium]|nr:response regulator [Anaerolineales bacterium]